MYRTNVEQCVVGIHDSPLKASIVRMNPKRPAHRKRIKHYDEPGHCRELTFSCYRQRPLLTNDSWRGLLSEAIDRAAVRHRYRLTAFVFMPDHVHLLVFPLQEASPIQHFLKGIKQPMSFRIKKLLEAARSPLLAQLTIRQRPRVDAFRFWQEGPGYDRNIDRGKTVEAAIDYIHLNPVRRCLVKRPSDWPWSSARWYENMSARADVRLPELHQLPASFLM